MNPIYLNLLYLVAAVLFIIVIKCLGHPRTAARGNMISASGMLLAIVATLYNQEIVGFKLIIVGILIGGAIGAAVAIKIKMTEMPEMVALFNGFGGIASIFVAGAELAKAGHPDMQSSVAIAVSGFIGSVTFWGSLVAFAKLRELIKKGPNIPARQPLGRDALLGDPLAGLQLADRRARQMGKAKGHGSSPIFLGRSATGALPHQFQWLC